MLQKPHRLTKKNDFDAVFKKGTGATRKFIAFRFLKSSLPYSRFGFVVSKKVSTKAVDRNRVRRRLRALTAHHVPSTPIDMVVVALPGATTKTFADFKEVVDSFFSSL